MSTIMYSVQYPVYESVQQCQMYRILCITVYNRVQNTVNAVQHCTVQCTEHDLQQCAVYRTQCTTISSVPYLVIKCIILQCTALPWCTTITVFTLQHVVKLQCNALECSRVKGELQV